MAIRCEARDVVSELFQPVSIEVAGIINQQRRTDLDDQSAIICEGQPGHRLANEKVLTVKRRQCHFAF